MLTLIHHSDNRVVIKSAEALYSHHIRSSSISWIWRSPVLTQLMEAPTGRTEQDASHADKAGTVWSEGQRLCRLPVSSGGDPSPPSTLPGSNAPIHQWLLPCFLLVHPPALCSDFSPPYSWPSVKHSSAVI